ncbi:AsnC family transcriptional regulator [Candidatus Bathyarchaeota archaeon]|nr:AsnC family transcriptional regulator [Candidatus Bathyarchaeota archaeon]
MDKLDYLILSELSKDAQMSFVTIAKKHGVTPFTVRKRYEKMKKKGIIFQSVISIDLSKLGYQGKAFLMINISGEHDRSLTISGLKKIRNIMVVTEIIGAFDILAIAPVTDLHSIRTLVNEVKKVPNVQRMEVACINDTAFPLSSSFGELLSRKSRELATT